jgi:pseudouridine-5'-phosphate glycosidase
VCAYASNSSLLDIKPEVQDAILNKRAVVALESTIITHGMPAPHNIKTALEVETIVREQVQHVRYNAYK